MEHETRYEKSAAEDEADKIFIFHGISLNCLKLQVEALEAALILLSLHACFWPDFEMNYLELPGGMMRNRLQQIE